MARCPSCSSEVGSGRFCPSCGAALTSDSQAPTRLSPIASTSSDPSRHGRFIPGALVGERYRIVALLGQGGMGEVYRGDDLKLGQAVALKFLPPGIENDAARLARFHDEVRIARQVAHPNVCRVYDVGEIDGHHFLTMEYVDGEDLASLLRRIGRLPADKGVEIARQISAGLAAAHDAGVLHRDLKPSNIMVDGRGRARITDFGLAALGDEVKGEDARSGTPAYMAPEQMEGRGVTQRTDLYALGLILYEIFTGKHPFAASSGAELLRKQTTSSPVSPSSVVEGLDPAVERIVLRCLNPDPARRPASALAVAAALPGGDPIAAALAAGETPSPEMVAAGGDSEGIGMKPAAAMFAGILLGLAVLIPLQARSQILLLAPLSKSPEVLGDRARDILRELGYPERPADSIAAFDVDRRYLAHLKSLRPPPSWPEAIGRPHPSVVRFRYRQSPVPLARQSKGTMGDWFLDPPPTNPGMVEVRLAPDGKLIGLSVVPPEQLSPGTPAGEPDWSRLLAAAGFAEGRLASVEPRWVPPQFADTRRAWQGSYPTSPPIPIRLEAAALAGKVVGFTILEPWDRDEMTVAASVPDSLIVRYARGAFFLLAITAALVVAVRNLRQGRGDWKGALRFAVYLGILRLFWMVGAHHLADEAEIDTILAHLAWSTWRVCMVATCYLAIEPYARRLWPRMLVSWVRLLDGRFRDPLVGRDILAGSLSGILAAFAGAVGRMVAERLGWPGSLLDAGVWTLESMRSFRQGVTALLGVHVTSALDMFFPLVVLLVLRLISGRTWIAIVGTTIFGAVATYPRSGSPIISLSVFTVAVIIIWTVLFRFGLLAMVVAVTTNELVDQLPLGVNPGAWYGPSTLLPLLVILALAIWGLKGSTSGRRWFRDSVFEPESARP